MDTSTVRARSYLGFLAVVLTLAAATTPARAGMTVLQPQGNFEVNANLVFPALTMGQTIKVPTNGDTSLVSFGLTIIGPSNAQNPQMMAEVYAWDGHKATGPSLYQSPVVPMPGGLSVNTPPAPIFNTGGINLQAGQEYVIFVALTPDASAYFNYLIAGSGPGYTDGSTVELASIDPAAWTTQDWHIGLPGPPPGDLPETDFIATFAAPVAAPEPSSLALAAIGSGIAIARTIRVRRKQRG